MVDIIDEAIALIKKKELSADEIIGREKEMVDIENHIKIFIQQQIRQQKGGSESA